MQSDGTDAVLKAMTAALIMGILLMVCMILRKINDRVRKHIF